MITGEQRTYIPVRHKQWTGDDFTGIAVVLGLIIFFVVVVRLLRHDQRRNLRRKIENRNHWNGAMREFDRASRRDPPDPDALEREAGKAARQGRVPRRDTAALPDSLTPEDFRALPDGMRAKLLGGVRGRKV